MKPIDPRNESRRVVTLFEVLPIFVAAVVAANVTAAVAGGSFQTHMIASNFGGLAGIVSYFVWLSVLSRFQQWVLRERATISMGIAWISGLIVAVAAAVLLTRAVVRVLAP